MVMLCSEKGKLQREFGGNAGGFSYGYNEKTVKYVGLGGSGEREGSGWRGGERDFTIILYFEHIRENEQ